MYPKGHPFNNLSAFGNGLNLAALSMVPDVHAHFGWLASLPIAGAIFQAQQSALMLVTSNRKFDDLALGLGRESALDIAQLAEVALSMIDEGRETHFQCWRSQDSVTPRELEISVARFGANGEMFLLSMVDRTAEAISRVNLRREMLSDSLTGFCNRTGFEDRVDTAVAHMLTSGATEPYAIILVDLARFSRVNESVGAVAGDELIITAARRLNARIRSNEILGRLGGNEFALFVPLDCDGHDVSKIAQRLADAFVEPCKLSSFEIQLECAFAAAVGAVGQDHPTDTLRHAQIALKRAKSSKKFELYTAGTVDNARRRFGLETDLRRALDAGELTLRYQPLVDLSTGRVSGFEALARWKHAEMGRISPADFIPVAEECGLIVPLGRWALDEAVRTIRKWDALGTTDGQFGISVNLSAVQLKRDDVVDAVSSALAAADVCGNRITLELTESAFISDPAGTKALLNRLKNLGVCLAMDDFGTGYSNLAYLQQLPIDILKIDRSFVSEMMVDQDKRAIVQTVLSLAHALGMKTTAEGIETAEISQVLKRLGCSVGQGYYFARPMGEDEAYAYLCADRAAATASVANC